MTSAFELIGTSGVSTSGLVSSGTDFIKSNIGTIAAGAGGLAVGATLAAVAVSAIKTKKKTTRRKSSSVSRGTRKKTTRRRTKSRGRTRRTPRTAGKGKDRSTKRIRYTKKGQPYVIMASGKARFIKKTSAKQSHKRKGGRY